MTEQQNGEQPQSPAAPPEEPPLQCGPCVVIKVAAFALFTAYIAADFATGGALTGWILTVLRSVIPGRELEGEQ